MARDLALLVPSRERPHNIARLIEAMDKTCRGDTHLIVGVDEDEPYLDEYRAFRECEVEVRPGLRHRLVRWLNLLALPRTGEYRFLGHIGDDNVPRTAGWDVRIIESLERNPFCFGDDLDPGRPPGSLSIHIFPHDCTNYNDYCEDPNGLNADIVKLGGEPFTLEALAEFNRALNIPRRWGS
jgi:hypothetical protein